MTSPQTTDTRFYAQNRFPGSCAACKTAVDARVGVAFQKAGKRWGVSHKAPECLGKALTPEELGDLEGILGAVEPDRRELTEDGRVYHPYPDPEANPGAAELLSAFPGTGDRNRPGWDRERKCRWVSLELGDRARVLELADKLGLTVAPSLRDIEDQIPADVQACLARAAAAGAYDYQMAGIRALALNSRYLMGDDMGLGKTMQALLAIPDGSGAIIVCPKSLKRNWADECATWRKDLTPVVCKLTKGKDFRWPKKNEVVITHYEALPAALTVAEKSAKYDAAFWEGSSEVIVIVDEAHRAKNPKAARSKKIQALSDACAKIWLLTGTPLLNKPFDLLGVLRAGGMDRKAFGGFRGFCKLFKAYQNRWNGWEFGTPDPSVPERLRRVMVRRLKADVLPELPPKQRQVLMVNDLDKKMRKLLDAEWKAYVAAKLGKTVKDLTDLDMERVSDDELPDFSQFSEIRALLAESRIPHMESFIEDCEEQDKPLLVFSAHRAPIDHLETREGWATITGSTDSDERAEIVKRFQAGELKGLGLTITAGGVGLTLTHASVVLFVDMDWVPANNLQAEDRVARIGQVADSIQIVQMVTDHALDRHVHKLLVEKMAMVQAAVEREVEYLVPEHVQVDQVDFDAARDVAANMDRTERLEAVERRAGLLDKAEREGRTVAFASSRGTSAGGKGWREVDLTAEQREALPQAWSLLLAMCDGAREKDGVGFSAGDVTLAHVAMPVLDDALALQVAFVTLQKYHGQLGDSFPSLFPFLAEESS